MRRSRILQLVLALVVLGVLIGGGAWWWFRPPHIIVPEAPVSSSVETAVRQIVSLLVPEGHAALDFRELDVSNLTAAEFKRELLAMKGETVTLWMPGESHWLLVGWEGTNRVSLAAAMEAFSVESETTVSLPEIFASYAGTREDVLPAFRSKLEGTVVPEWFMTRAIPAIPWLDTTGIDADILRATLAEIRSFQVVRRELLEGNMLAQTAKGKEQMAKAAEKWGRVRLRNPRDPMLLERVDRLSRNARGFLEVGKVLQAMKCYETMILINPTDAVAIHNFGMCLKRIGKLDMAEKVLARAKKLSENKKK